MDEMITISAVEPQKRKKDRYNIYAGGEYLCSLSAQSLVVFGIKEGKQIDIEKLKNAVEADNTQYAFDSAVNLLSFKMRTKKEITDKLLDKKIDEEAVKKAIKKLEDYGYLNDEEYAVLFVQSAVSEARYGRKVVEYKLKQKGIGDDIIDKTMLIFNEDEEREIASKHYWTLKEKYKKEEQMKRKSKIYSNMARRGFSYDIINSLIAEDDGFE